MQPETTISQADFLEKLRPFFKTDGQLYRKHRHILAKQAQKGEKIATITSDGLETVNTAKEGDFIIQNRTEAGEQYLLGAEKFAQKYAFHQAGPSEEWNEYRPTGQIIALEITEALLKSLDLPDNFFFTAKWNEKMAAKQGDYLAAPENLNEVYRIARKEFFETYIPLEV